MRGSITQKPDGRWTVRWWTPDGKHPRAILRTRKAAEKYLRDRIDEAELGVGHIDRNVTVAEFAENGWSSSKPASVSPRTWSTYDSHYRTHIKPIVGGVKLFDVSTRTVQHLADSLTAQGKAPKTVRCVCATFTQIIGMASAQGRCKPLPRERHARAHLPKHRRRQLVVPTPSQVVEIANAIASPLYALVLVCGFMALRQGEVIALHPSDIDWASKRIWVHRHVDKETGIREEGTKEDAGAWVTMPTIVADALRTHTAEYPSDEWVFNSLGKPYTASRIDKAWRAACKRAGISGVRFHDLRHAAASLMITAGWNIKRVQTEMRHSDPAFTIRVYGHLFPHDDERDRDRLDRALGTALSGPDAGQTRDTGAGRNQ